jgi:hypothetical protein
MHSQSTGTLEVIFSERDRVKEFADPVTVSMGPGPDYDIDMVSTKMKMHETNGFCLYFEENWSTVATLTRDHCIAVGAGYSGCLYSVYDAGHGVFKCVHTARPGGGAFSASPDHYVVGLQRYALDRNWNLVQAVPTVGLVGQNGCVGVLIMTRISYDHPVPIVRTVRLQRDANLNSVGRARWEGNRQD